MTSDTPHKKLRKRATKAKADTMRRHVLVCTGGDCKPGDKVAKTLKHAVALAGKRAETTVVKTGSAWRSRNAHSPQRCPVMLTDAQLPTRLGRSPPKRGSGVSRRRHLGNVW